MPKLRQLNDLRYGSFYAVAVIGVAIGWNAITKTTAERMLLPVLCPEADPAARPLRVTKNDGSLSNGEKLHGWRNAVYFGVHGGLWMAGCLAINLALAQVWPRRMAPGEAGSTGAEKPGPTDDLI